MGGVKLCAPAHVGEIHGVTILSGRNLVELEQMFNLRWEIAPQSKVLEQIY